MMRKPRPWIQQAKRGASGSLNLVAGAAATLLSAATWNPLPLILWGLYQPVGVYRSVTSPNFQKEIRTENREKALATKRHQAEWLRDQLRALIYSRPIRDWIEQGRLPDYMSLFESLRAIRERTRSLVATRSSAARALEDDILEQMDDMLRSYLLMVKERLLFHCALARFYPQIPEAPPLPEAAGLGSKIKNALWSSPQPERRLLLGMRGNPERFVSVEEAIEELRGKIKDVEVDIARDPEHEEIYRPSIAMLEKRIEAIRARSANDRRMEAQMRGFPEQFDYILSSIAGTDANDTEVAGQMQLLIEQTEVTVTAAREMRELQREVAG